MTLRWLLAAAHLLGLGIGLGAVWARGRALRQPLDGAGLRRVFAADAWWGLSALIWIGTGLARLFLETEKPIEYYVGSGAFLVKMTLLALVLALEIGPMVAFVRWRRAVGHGQPVDTGRARTFAATSLIQALLVVAMVLAATAMARGVGA